ncbi:dsRBD fold-containing protein [Streptomyces sp. NPDC101118]|uniref:dsRBD fold-containing protein n=1 Tax=Streptomyces sp. NPDC101118 TaxID=3366109 RepID=UPI0038274BC3
MSHTVEWQVRLSLLEDQGTTSASLEVDTGTATLTGHGTARCAPQDTDIPAVGDELAAARALEDLAVQLRRTAYGDMQAAGAPSAGSLKPYAGWLDMSAS